MIDLITGVPGSGKTYYAVYKLNELIKEKEKKYKHIFTNINGLDIEKCNNIADVSDYVKSFEFLDLNRDIEKEFYYHKKAKNLMIQPILKTNFIEKTKEEYDFLLDSDKLKYDSSKKIYEKNKEFIINQRDDINLKENYDDYVKSRGIYKLYSDSLVIIDECHLYFEDRQDEKLIRFLSYHRHFNIDLYLITQNKNLINKKYLSFIETMYMAFPASKRLFSKVFRYRKYASYQEYHSNIIGTESLKLKKEVFSLYSSGSNRISKSVFTKMLIPILLGVFSIIIAFNFVVGSMTSSADTTNNKIIDSNISNYPSQDIVYDDILDETIPILKNTKFYSIDCFTSSCVFKNNNLTFNRDTILELLHNFNCETILTDVVDLNYVTYVLECNSDLTEVLNLFNIKKIGVKNEKNNSSNSSYKLFNR